MSANPMMAIQGMRSWLAAQLRMTENVDERFAFQAALNHLDELCELWDVSL